MLKVNRDNHEETLLRFVDYKNRRLKQKIIRSWNKMMVQRKIANLFVMKKYVRALQDYVFKECYVKPFEHYNRVLKKKTISTLGVLKNKIRNKQRDAMVERALRSKRDHHLMMRCFL